VSQSVREVRLPKLGDTVVEGTILRWLVAVGDEVGEGQPLAEIETDKVTTEYPSEEAGTVVEILIDEGRTVPVGTPILRLGGLDAATARGKAGPDETLDQSRADAPAAQPASGGRPARPKPTGAARAAAARSGVDLDALRGSGPHGRVRLADVRSRSDARDRAPSEEAPRPGSPAPSARPSAPAGTSGRVIELSRMRRAIAEHMSRSWATTPHALACAEIDVQELLALRNRERARFRRAHGVDLSPFALIVAAIGDALAAELSGPVDLGIATALDDGLIVPALRDAGRSWRETAPELAALIARARAGRLVPDEVRGAHSTVTNIGVFGGHWAQPILSEGQPTIFALGAISDQPRALADPAAGTAGGITWRAVLPISLGYDAARLDPVEASLLLERVDASLHTLASETAA
jgi:pyruvate/2-oxoglutarate dehydrogenase complex dihydrolipoamide acyltransferase (E2) component